MHVFNSMGQVLHEWSKIANGTLFLYLSELFLTKCLENIKWWKVALLPPSQLKKILLPRASLLRRWISSRKPYAINERQN